MAKRRNSGDQFSLDLQVTAKRTPHSTSSASAPKIVGFLDSGTLAIRRDAIKRVQSSGIFPAPAFSRSKA